MRLVETTEYSYCKYYGEHQRKSSSASEGELPIIMAAGPDGPISRWSRSCQLQPAPSLALFYAAWKALLALVVLGCPAPGYDTSITVLTGTHAAPAISKFIRWDSIYFLQAAQRGYVYEQEWAFSYTYSSLVRWLASGRVPGLSRWAWHGLISAMGECSRHHEGTPFRSHCRDRRRRVPREPCPFRAHPVVVVANGAG